MADELQLVHQKIKDTKAEVRVVENRLKAVAEQLGAGLSEEIYNRLNSEWKLLMTDLDALRQKENLLLEQRIRSGYRHAFPSKEQFWEQLPSATFAMSPEGYEILQLAPGTKLPLPYDVPALLCRPCYRTLSEKIFASVANSGSSPRFLILGTPGIGKSIFLYYLLHQLACLGKTVVWYGEYLLSVLLYTPNGVFQADSIAAFSEELENPNTWFLCDGVEPVSTAAITVMASLPRSSKYQKYDKEGPIQLWMGPWSVSELKAARDAIFTSVDADELQRLYVRWGGIPDFVLKFANAKFKQQLFDICISASNGMRIYEAVRDIEAASDDILNLLYIQVNEECKKIGVVFGSVEIAQRMQQLLMQRDPLGELLYQCSGDLERDSVWFDDLLYWSAGKPELASLRAQLFESAAHEALCKGGTFRVRSLSNPEQQVSQLKVGQMEQKVVWDSDLKEVNLETTKSGCLMVPVSKDFPAAVDSFLLLPSSECRPGRLLFILATFTAQRPISVRGLLDAVQKLSGDLRGLKRELYFAVPPELFDSFTEQHFDGLETEVDTIKMEQFAIEVPVAGFCTDVKQSSPGSASSSSSSSACSHSNGTAVGRGIRVAPSALSRSSSSTLAHWGSSHRPRMNPHMVLLRKSLISRVSTASRWMW